MERMQADVYIFFKVKTEILEFCYKLNMRHTL